MALLPARLRPRGDLVIAPKHLGNFGNSVLILPDTVTVREAPLLELTARYRFLSAWFFYFAVRLILICIFFAELWTRQTPKSAARILLGLLAVVAFTMVFNTIEPKWMGSFKAYQRLGTTLFRDALGQGWLRACETSRPCEGRGAFYGMEFLMDKANHVTSLVAAAVIAGMALVDAVSLYRGTSYSVLILSYYMPVSLILMVRIDRFHRAVAAHGDAEVGGQVMGFDINRIASLDAFKKIIAIVSPILASALGAAVTFEGIGG